MSIFLNFNGNSAVCLPFFIREMSGNSIALKMKGTKDLNFYQPDQIKRVRSIHRGECQIDRSIAGDVRLRSDRFTRTRKTKICILLTVFYQKKN
jgi:hypothetical protein